jgi:hypothetical protein
MILILKKVIVLGLIIISGVVTYGQKANSNKTNQIKFSPLRLVDPVNPGIELGYEKFISNHFSTQLSVTYIKDLFKITSFSNHAGVRVSLEEKYYRKPQRKLRTYYSGEVVYLKINYTAQSEYIKDTALMTPKYSDTFNIAKQTFCFNLKYGVQIPIKRFSLDISAGAGIKYKMVKRSGINNINAIEQVAIDPNIYDIANKEGSKVAPNLTMNIKLAYNF